MSPLRDLAELVRAPAALSVPGDAIAGAVSAHALGVRTAGLAAASVCLYWAGMAANDWADRDLDARERPERPIPSGRVSPGAALALAAGLTGVGLAAARLSGGRRAMAVAAPLAVTVWAYDLFAKRTRAGPAVMALARALDVLLGATPGRTSMAVPAALRVGAHTYLLTELSRAEVTGSRRGLPAATLGATLALAATTVIRPRGTARDVAGLVADSLLAGAYLASFGLAQARAVDEPSAARIRAAVGSGITGLPALQGALTARAGARPLGLGLAAAVPLARRLARRTSPT
jgi:hypothetical protein